MAGNEWINGYLEAILDSGAPAIEELKSSAVVKGNFNPTKYFVEEVVTGVDESDLHRTWIKVVATRNTRERSSRLENMCWRIWHLARKKKQLQLEGMQRLSKRRLEMEQGRKDVTEDMSEDLSEAEKVEVLGEVATIDSPKSPRSPGSPKKKFQPNSSSTEAWLDKKLYIVLISLHGLVRGENMELGRDSDTGGQIKYVVELARALAKMPGIYRVDLFTRQVSSPDVDWSYGEPTEMLTTGPEDANLGESSGAYIIRIPFGPPNQYLRKELLWPYIQEFVDGALAHILNMSKALGEQIGGGQPVWPYVIHGHYADAGDSAALLSGALNVPMVLTGHSLGRNKLEQLLKQGRQSKEDIDSTYRIMRRIEAEELSLDAAELVITSTKQEIEEQWGLYDGFDVKLEKVLRARARRGVSCHGRFMPRMAVIPPGMDFSNVIQEDIGDHEGDLGALMNTEGSSPRAVPAIWSEVLRFLTNPHKPIILALSRPDPKKNITTLVKAFGECRALRELANLVLIMGNRDDIDGMSGGNANVLITVLKLIDRYDLYGQVAFPKHHKQNDVPDIYRLAAKTKGVFINPAFIEPFGLTLIEAAAHGLPMVATKNGGPVDIHQALNNGLLVDPHNQQEIAEALLKLVSEKNLWNECRRNGLKNIHLYSWPEHCRTYLTRIAACRMRHPLWKTDTPTDEAAESESLNDSLKDVQDMSLRLSIDGEKSSLNESTTDVTAAQAPAGTASDKPEAKDPVKWVLSKLRRNSASRDSESDKKQVDSSKYPILRKRRRLIVIALDCYDSQGAPEKKMINVIQDLFKAVKLDQQMAKETGFALSTAMPMSELTEFFKSGKVKAKEFDALICSSGSEVYYPSACGKKDGKKLVPDPDYASHIEYRWGSDGLKKTIWKLMNTSEGDKNASSSSPSNAIKEDAKSSNSHCLSYLIKDFSKAKKVDDMRQKLRMRGLRCHLMYCRNSTRMQVIPLLASRSQALRYLFVRWRLNVSNMYVVLGETGDTDYEEMLSGTHKTLIMKGIVAKGSEDLIRSPGSYVREDIVPGNNPLIEEGAKPEDIAEAITKLSKAGN
ncbi:probable sucrose-phosphate synthase 2 [Andrographis paniculata]|uniref:probable sucrose-phosphate synthase 2 n=1 Tax=Andrographis paniculata TaxID=175694 RepID=UPI0021E6DE6F|nr:probable sucrose-phosphate synthase 2 [Andrographis paniculata]